MDNEQVKVTLPNGEEAYIDEGYLDWYNQIKSDDSYNEEDLKRFIELFQMLEETKEALDADIFRIKH